MKIGVLGGTFDPLHNGHLTVAEEVRTQLDLTEVIFVPTGQPWLKAGTPISAAEHRVQMVRLAVADKPYFKLSTVEVDRVGPSYTVDTIPELKAQFRAQDKLYFILSWDTLAQLPQWREATRLIKMCHWVAVPRGGYSRPDLNSLEASLPGLSRRLILLDKPEINIGATEIRKRVAQGLPIYHLVPEAVDDYIRKHKLYLSN